MNHSMPGVPVHYQLLEFTQTHIHRVSDAIQPSHPLSSPSLLPPIPPSIRVFSSESTLHMTWPKYWSFSFSIIPSKEIPGLIFRRDWLNLLAVQGTLKSLLQHHSSKASTLRHSAFFTVQLSHPYMTTGKTIALTRWTFVGKVMSLLLNMLFRLVITFLPRSKRLFVSNSLRPHGLQHTRLLCPSPTPGAYSNSCSLSQWCNPTISSSVIPFSSCPQSFPASGSFLMSQVFASGGQSIGASASVLPMNIQDWFPLGLTGWISLQSKGLSRVFSNTVVQKHQFFGTQPSLWSNSHIHTWLLEKYLTMS